MRHSPRGWMRAGIVKPWLDLNCQRNCVFHGPKGRWDGVSGPIFFEACLSAQNLSCGLGRPPVTQKASLLVNLIPAWSCLLTCLCACPGEQRPAVVGMEIRDLNLKDPWVKTFGTIDGGLELMNAAWPAMCQVFAVRCEDSTKTMELLCLLGCMRLGAL